MANFPSQMRPKTSGLAIASFLCGIAAICSLGVMTTDALNRGSKIIGFCTFCTMVVTALVGLVLGILAMRKINHSGGQLGGNGLAILGTAVSGGLLLFIAFFTILIIYLVTHFSAA